MGEDPLASHAQGTFGLFVLRALGVVGQVVWRPASKAVLLLAVAAGPLLLAALLPFLAPAWQT